MLSPTFQTPFDTPNIKIGLCWFIETKNGVMSYEHRGGDLGYLSWLELLPEQKTGIAILINYDGAPVNAIRTKVKEILLTKYVSALSQ